MQVGGVSGVGFPPLNPRFTVPARNRTTKRFDVERSRRSIQGPHFGLRRCVMTRTCSRAQPDGERTRCLAFRFHRH